MIGPHAYRGFSKVDRKATIAGLTIDLYPAPRGVGWWTPADPIFDLAGIAEGDRSEWRRERRMTDVHFGFATVDVMSPSYAVERVSLLSPNSVLCVLLNAPTAIDPATIAAIEAALAA